MDHQKRLSLALFSLRITVFLVFFMWTLYKFINPSHSATIFSHFYGLNVSQTITYILGGAEMLIIFGFLLGVYKRFTYGLVFIFHLVSTLSSYKQYLAPYSPPHLLFFAAWPMLAACFALYLLRDHDKMLSIQ